MSTTTADQLWPNADKRRAVTRRMIERANGYAEQLGGFDQIAASQIDLLKRAVSLSVWLEDADEAMANGLPSLCSLEEYDQASRLLRRIISSDLTPNRRASRPPVRSAAVAAAEQQIAAWKEARRATS